MQADKPVGDTLAAPASVRARILGDVEGPQDEELIFAASSIINEITSPTYTGEAVVREVRTENGSYTLRGSRISRTDGLHPVVLVYTESKDVPVIASPKQRLRERFGLTRKESEVALLLAAEKSNEQIADALFISRHTARHHTQSILAKLGVQSRRDVAEVMSKAESEGLGV